MIPEKMLQILSSENVVAIVTQGAEGAHVVNTWNSYITISKDESMLAPVGHMMKTESNLKANNKVLVTMGSRDVQGMHAMGTGFLISGTAGLVYEGSQFDEVKQKFPWARAALQIKPESITQTL